MRLVRKQSRTTRLRPLSWQAAARSARARARDGRTGGAAASETLLHQSSLHRIVAGSSSYHHTTSLNSSRFVSRRVSHGQYQPIELS